MTTSACSRSRLILAWLAAIVALPVMASAQTPAARAAISGRVVDAYPGATPQPDVVLYRRMDGPPLPGNGRVPVRPDRTFVIENLDAGLYELYANYSFPRQLVTVGATDVTGVELVVSGQSRVIPVGRMDDGSELPPGGGAIVHLAPLRSAGSALESPDGFTVPPGLYWLFVAPPPGTFVKSMLAGDVDLRRAPLRIEPGAAPRRVDVVLTRTKPADAPVTTVAGSAGQAGLEVELVDLMHGRRATLVAATTTDASGGFRFANVVPGFYRINLPPPNVSSTIWSLGPTRSRSTFPCRPVRASSPVRRSGSISPGSRWGSRDRRASR